MHCILVYITKDDGTFEEVPHIKLPQDFVLFTEKPKARNRLVAYCETDYFGGAGDQGAKVWNNKKLIFHKYTWFGAINEALKLLGVKCEDGKDEFDTIGLGRFRSNEDIEESIYKSI